jgi:hypothetical protein
MSDLPSLQLVMRHQTVCRQYRSADKKTRLCCSRMAEQKGALEMNETKLVFV